MTVHWLSAWTKFILTKSSALVFQRFNIKYCQHSLPSEPLQLARLWRFLEDVLKMSWETFEWLLHCLHAWNLYIFLKHQNWYFINICQSYFAKWRQRNQVKLIAIANHLNSFSYWQSILQYFQSKFSEWSQNLLRCNLCFQQFMAAQFVKKVFSESFIKSR